MLCRLAIECTDKPTIRALCEFSGLVNHSTVSIYITRGAFSQVMAEKFEEKFGAEHITAAQLTNPLEIHPAYDSSARSAAKTAK